VCRDIRSKPQHQRRDKINTERRRAERKIKDELREEIIQLEIDYYAKRECAMKQAGLRPWSNAGTCDIILKEMT
jgi:hypothetical protein